MTAEQDTAIFKDFVFGDSYTQLKLVDNPNLQSTIEAATRAVAKEMSTEDRVTATEALLAKLKVAKDKNPCPQRKDLLKIEYINALVNAIVIVNMPLLVSIVQSKKGRSYKDLEALALGGPNSIEANPTGMIGAILTYDKARGKFSDHVGNAIYQALSPSKKEKAYHKEISQRTFGDGKKGEELLGFVDVKGDAPDKHIINKELLEAINRCIEKFTSDQSRNAAKYMFGNILNTGKKPSTDEMIAYLHINNSTRFYQVMEKAFKQLQAIMREDYPQLSQYMDVNGWNKFREALDKIALEDQRREIQRGLL